MKEFVVVVVEVVVVFENRCCLRHIFHLVARKLLQVILKSKRKDHKEVP